MTDEPFAEDLPAPRPPRRSLKVLIVLVVVALGAIGVVRIAGALPHRTPVAAVPTELPSSTAPHTVPLPVPHEIRAPHFHVPPPCPRATDGQVACTTFRTVPPAFRLALRVAFPGVRIDAFVTQVLRPTGPEVLRGMWSRQLLAHAGPARIRLSVGRLGSVERPTSIIAEGTRPSGRTIVLAQLVRGGYVIQLEASGPTHRAPLFDVVDRLVFDRRLVRPVVAPGGTMAG